MIEQATTKYGQVEQNRAFAQGLQQLKTEHPAFFDNIEGAIEAVPAAVADTLYSVIESGTPQQRIGALKTLALLTGGQHDAATLQQAAQQIGRDQALAADEAITEASVASATATNTSTVTAADKIGQEWETIEAPLRDGWNI